MTLNVSALEATAKYWTAINDEPRAINIEIVRREVRGLKLNFHCFGKAGKPASARLEGAVLAPPHGPTAEGINTEPG